jgi:hypothetical protein
VANGRGGIEKDIGVTCMSKCALRDALLAEIISTLTRLYAQLHMHGSRAWGLTGGG